MPPIKTSLKRTILSLPILGPAVRAAVGLWRKEQTLFPGSAQYWRERYRQGGNSGPGSRGQLAKYKADFLNKFVEREHIESVVELGCGDGYQLTLAEYPRYVGYDISPEALERCHELFHHDETKRFLKLPQERLETGDLALSLDVIFHLIEDSVFELYMRQLFAASKQFVIIYSSDTDLNDIHLKAHMRNRNFSRWVEENIDGWTLVSRESNPYPMEDDPTTGSISDFFVYARA